ncbi:hypothetical protein [Burkholderia lata]|uniref:hypothetical protein n=1 Tax=Burkholderia lata (strain ATCC 17760 / DSM 23089 / LMG 22485 / NCIMB 9086 / R18194 / 383) TaxID=482957 RepID=UPI0020C5B5B2|nr:hypothetical protein [Burkholderia lata]
MAKNDLASAGFVQRPVDAAAVHERDEIPRIALEEQQAIAVFGPEGDMPLDMGDQTFREIGEYRYVAQRWSVSKGRHVFRARLFDDAAT